MRALYFDAFSGVSGDMTLGALLSLGVDAAQLRAELACLPLEGYELRISTRELSGIRACKVDIEDRAADHGGHARHTHRAYGEIRSMIEGSALGAVAKEKALAIFRVLAEAEARVHGVAADAVEFHEVGALDSIVDIVGAAIGIAALGAERVYVSSLPLGSGCAPSQHGVIPVPAPATVELLRGFEVRIGEGAGEMVTPTGAAIVAALATPGEALPAMRVEAVGYGAGTRTLADRPNVLRLVLGSVDPASRLEPMVVVEANIDDCNPELYEHAMERLFEAGARDVWLTPAHMKRNRPATTLHVLADPARREAVAEIILRETSSIGVRFHPVQRLALAREVIEVHTEHGSVSVKIARAADGSVNIAPEYASCRRAALARGVPLKDVYQAAIAAARRR